MPMIDTFCEAFRQAITDYETEMAGNVPAKRQAIIVELRALLDERQRQHIDSLSFREEMTEYVRNMPVSTFGLISFKSRLQEKLRAVLDRPCFSDNKLSIAERDEIRSRHENEIKGLKVQVVELANLLINERAKDNVAAVNTLTFALAKEKENTAYLTNANTQLNQSVTELMNKCKTVQKENTTLRQEKAVVENNYQALREKYEALLREKSSANGANSHSTQETFFNESPTKR